jgi:hypothetical protein
MSLPSLVTVLPEESVEYLLPLLRGSIPADKRQAAACGLELVSYAGNLALPAGASQPFMTSMAPLTLAEAADHLERSLVQHRAGTFSATAVPWQQLISAILPVILSWLSGA